MIEHILVGLDGSKVAEAVLPYVERIARAGGVGVTLVRVVPAPVAADLLVAEGARLVRYGTALATDAVAEADQNERRESERYLDDVAARLRSRGIVVETTVDVGDPAQALIAEADLRKADLICLCTHGRSGVGRWVYGSVAEAVVAESHVPVFLARAWLSPSAGMPSGGKGTILVAFDGSPRSEHAISVGANLAGPLAAELRLVQVVSPIDESSLDAAKWIVDVSRTTFEAEESQARADLAEHAHRLSQAGISATATVRLDSIGTGIVDEAKESGATLIVMATHANSGLARLLVHSVALEVLHRADLPLVLVGPAVPD